MKFTPTRSIPLLAAAMLSLCALPTEGQNTSYSQAYQQMLQKRPGMSAGTDRYMYNKYFRNNPAVSPYISGALLGGSESGTAYTTTIRPDLQRRQAATRAQAQYVQQRKMQGNIGYTVNPGALTGGLGGGYQAPRVPGGAAPNPSRTNGALQNHWYGGWKR